MLNESAIHFESPNLPEEQNVFSKLHINYDELRRQADALKGQKYLSYPEIKNITSDLSENEARKILTEICDRIREETEFFSFLEEMGVDFSANDFISAHSDRISFKIKADWLDRLMAKIEKSLVGAEHKTESGLYSPTEGKISVRAHFFSAKDFIEILASRENRIALDSKQLTETEPIKADEELTKRFRGLPFTVAHELLHEKQWKGANRKINLREKMRRALQRFSLLNETQTYSVANAPYSPYSDLFRAIAGGVPGGEWGMSQQDREKIVSALVDIEQIRALNWANGKKSSEKEIADLIYSARWTKTKGQVGHFDSLKNRKGELLAEHHLDEEDAEQIRMAYRTHRFIQVMKAKTIAQETLVRK